MLSYRVLGVICAMALLPTSVIGQQQPNVPFWKLERFPVHFALRPVITSINPAAAMVGDWIEIHGWNLDRIGFNRLLQVTDVYIRFGIPFASYATAERCRFPSSILITCKVPQGATDGPIYIVQRLHWPYKRASWQSTIVTGPLFNVLPDPLIRFENADSSFDLEMVQFNGIDVLTEPLRPANATNYLVYPRLDDGYIVTYKFENHGADDDWILPEGGQVITLTFEQGEEMKVTVRND